MRTFSLISLFCLLVAFAKTQELPRTGVNLTWQNMAYFSSSAAFTDAMKQSSEWYGEFSSPIGDHGYPTALGPDEFAQRFIFLETVHYPLGEYTLKWEGSGSLMISTAGDGDFVFDQGSVPEQSIPVTNIPNDEGIMLTILETDPADPIRNVRFFLPTYDENSSYWTDHYIDFHAQFGVTRFAWGSGMYSPQQEWEQRSRVEDISWSDSDLDPLENNGLPYEVMADLANRAGVDLWVCTPVRASREYQQQLATLLREALNPELRLWIEWGNEYWNCGYWGYEGCAYLTELFNQNGLYRPQNYALQALELFEDFDSVFTAAGQRNRLLTVLGGQADNHWELQESAAYIQQQARMDEVDLFAIAPYLHGGEPVNEAYNSGGLDEVFPLLDTIVQRAYSGQGETGQEWSINFETARQYGKPLVAYEGGQHLTSWVGLKPGLSAEINRDPRMYSHYCHYFDRWQAVDVTSTFVHFADIAAYNDDEAFALKEYYDQPLSEAPKLRAFLDCMSTVSATDEAPTAGPVLRLFPNPASQQVQLAWPVEEKIEQLELIDATGRQLQAWQVTGNQMVIPLQGRPSGWYLLRATGPAGSRSLRFILH